MFERSGRRLGAPLVAATLAWLVLLLAGLSPATAKDLWSVPAVAVDGTGTSPSMAKDAALAKGLNAHAGTLTHEGVGEALGLDWTDPATLLS